MSGVTALCGLAENRNLLLFYQQPNLPRNSQQTPLDLTGAGACGAPHPTPDAQGWDQTTAEPPSLNASVRDT